MTSAGDRAAPAHDRATEARTRDDTPAACDEHHCVTCGDDGVPMTVVCTDPERGLALCADAHGVHHTVETALVEPVAPGAELLVHAGTAIAGLTTQGTVR